MAARLGNISGDSNRLKDVFERGFKLHQEIETADEPSNSDSVQRKVERSIECCVQCTEMVNQLELFSCNEDIDEVPTTDLRYLLLPALLADLTLVKMSEERMEDIRAAKIYCVDFLKRCQNYGVTEEDISVHVEESECEGIPQNGKRGLQQMESSREAKIRRYKQTKQREQRLKELGAILHDTGQSVDEEVQREHALLLIKLWIDKCIEHIASIKSELEVLEHMQKMRKQNGGELKEPAKPPPRPPMKPVLITREMIKSKVFGAGYPSVPTMSEEEFFQKEIREGKIVMEYKSDSKSKTHDGEEEEEEKESKEEDEDEETPEKLAKARAWDDWKDDHRRGWGNTDNRG